MLVFWRFDMGLLDPILGAFGTQSAGEEQRKYANAAMDRLKTGYGDANALLNPIYKQGLGAFQGLGDKYAAGGFNAPHMDPFQLNNFQTDPGYEFTKSQGEGAILGRAAAGGMAHSPQTTKALMGYDTGLANQTYNDIFNRQKNASDTAFNQNLAGSGQNFQQGMSLSQPAFSAANTMGQNNIGLGEGLSGIEQQKGQIASQLAMNPFSAASGTLGGLTSMFNPMAAGSSLLQGGIGKMDPGMLQDALMAGAGG
jgi:hypothetical protein